MTKTFRKTKLSHQLNGPFSTVRLRDTNPNLYRSLMTVGIIYTALGVNFLIFTPTFEQFGIPKNVIGAGFLLLGLSFLLFLNYRRNLKVVRILLIVGIFYSCFWGIGTTETLFAGTSSAQLFIVYFGLSALQVPLLLEPFFNPITANGATNEIVEKITAKEEER